MANNTEKTRYSDAELQEFKEYTWALNTVHPCRLSWGNIIKGFSGVPRALSVISRYAYYEKKMDPEMIDILLKKWCGFDIGQEQNIMDDMPEFANVSGWLPSSAWESGTCRFPGPGPPPRRG